MTGARAGRRAGRRPSGFSRVLALVLAAVAAILAVVAISSSVGYSTRSKVNDAVAVAGACKVSVADFLARAGRPPRDAREAGCSESSTDYTARTEVAGSAIRVTMRKINPQVDGKLLSLQALDDSGAPADGTRPIVQWRCGTNAEAGAYKYFPAACRQSPR